MIRAVAAGTLRGSVLLAARASGAPGDAYCALTGYDDDSYLDLIEPSTTDGAEPDDEDEEDEDEDDDGSGAAWLEQRLPRLMALFPL